MSKLDALTNFAVFIKFMRKEGFLMKKMLAKAVVLGLVLGGIGFVANDAQAADIGNGVGVYSGAGTDLTGRDVKTTNKLPDNTVLAEQKDLLIVNQKAADAKTAADAAKTTAEAAKTTADAAKTTADEAKAAAVKNAGDIQTNADNIETNKKAISDETEARIKADNELGGRINTEAAARKAEDARIEAKFDGEVSRLDSKIDKLDARVEKVGAMAAAIANLHTMGYDPEAPTEIAVGVGQYRDKTGMALGAFHYPNRDFMLSFSVSTAGDEYMGGIGATWKFGRKTPEELRQAEAEKAAKAKLAKAEAAKKAAKDARVAAQQKRHAEMLAARTAK